MWGRKKKDAGNAGFTQREVIGYKRVWERKRLPDPGSQNYAYETYALAPLSPISSAVAIRGAPPRLYEQQIYVGQSVSLDGIPTTAGQIVTQPLYNTETGGFVSAFPVPLSPLSGINYVAIRADPIPTNAVEPWSK
jgi:hypothetical protein